MKIDSLAFQTDLFFHRFTGVVIEHDNYLVVMTPTNPGFFWGNLVYFKTPPKEDSLLIWREIFAKEFKSMSVSHMTFAWDSTAGEEGSSQLFVDDGFNFDKAIVMVCENACIPSKLNDNLIIRPIEKESEWQMVLENHVLCRADHFEEIPYRKFVIRQMNDYRSMLKENRGEWLGAFLGDKLVGDLGIFAENGLGRFQTIGTHPDFRRQGVCSTLLYKSCLYAKEKMNIDRFVIVADPNYHAAKIYESVGFEIKEFHTGLCKYNKSVWVT